jgi:prefoldin subunit 5
MATSKIKNVNIGETSDSTKRKNPCSPDDLPGHQKQVSRQTKPRKLSYSADDLDKSGIDDTKVEQILAKKPGITFNIQELVCSVLKDDSFINKLVPKICESVCQKLEEKYVNLVNDVVKPLQESVIKQAELIKQQSTTIDKHVVKLTQHEHTVNKQDEHIKTLQQTVTDLKGNITDLQNNLSDLDIRLEDQEQYSRRTSLRFHNIPCGDTRNLYKMNTDQIILDICNDVLKVPITINEIGRTHPIGKVRGGKIQVIARFSTYRQRNLVFSAKRNLKNHKDNVFITENLTPRRRKIMDELNYLRVKRRIQACWSHDGRIFAIGVNSRSTDLITCIDDIYFMLDKYPENPSSADTELPEPVVDPSVQPNTEGDEM